MFPGTAQSNGAARWDNCTFSLPHFSYWKFHFSETIVLEVGQCCRKAHAKGLSLEWFQWEALRPLVVRVDAQAPRGVPWGDWETLPFLYHFTSCFVRWAVPPHIPATSFHLLEGPKKHGQLTQTVETSKWWLKMNPLQVDDFRCFVVVRETNWHREEIPKKNCSTIHVTCVCVENSLSVFIHFVTNLFKITEYYPHLTYMKVEALRVYSSCKVSHYSAKGLKEYGFHYRYNHSVSPKFLAHA